MCQIEAIVIKRPCPQPGNRPVFCIHFALVLSRRACVTFCLCLVEVEICPQTAADSVGEYPHELTADCLSVQCQLAIEIQPQTT